MHTDDSRVAGLAYERFLARGGEHGHDVEDWLAAEAEVSRAPYDVVLADAGPNTIELVRVLRDRTQLPLPQIRRAIETLPHVITRCSLADARALCAALEPLGARVDLQPASGA